MGFETGVYRGSVHSSTSFQPLDIGSQLDPARQPILKFNTNHFINALVAQEEEEEVRFSLTSETRKCSDLSLSSSFMCGLTLTAILTLTLSVVTFISELTVFPSIPLFATTSDEEDEGDEQGDEEDQQAPEESSETPPPQTQPQTQPLPEQPLGAQQQLQVQKQQPPNLSASSIYQTKTMVLGNDIKNLVILIPNEGHEPSPEYSQPPPEELRVINQPYIPQNAVVNVGTAVTWFNADVGHPHIITLVDNSTNNVVYDSGEFEEFTASSPITLNNTGAFSYSGPSFADEFPDFLMKGTLTVVDQPFPTFASATNASSSGAATDSGIDTVTTLMVPANLIEEISSELQGQGLGMDNQYMFDSLRGGDSTTGDEEQQVLLVLTSSGKDINQVVSALQEIVPTLPYS